MTIDIKMIKMIKTLFPVPLPADIVDHILGLAWNGYCLLSPHNGQLCSKCGNKAKFICHGNQPVKVCEIHILNFKTSYNDGVPWHRKCYSHYIKHCIKNKEISGPQYLIIKHKYTNYCYYTSTVNYSLENQDFFMDENSSFDELYEMISDKDGLWIATIQENFLNLMMKKFWCRLRIIN